MNNAHPSPMAGTYSLSSKTPDLESRKVVVRKEVHSRYKNGYSNWDGKVNYVQWTVNDDKNSAYTSGDSRKEAVFEYLCLMSQREGKPFKHDKLNYKLTKLSGEY